MPNSTLTRRSLLSRYAALPLLLVLFGCGSSRAGGGAASGGGSPGACVSSDPCGEGGAALGATCDGVVDPCSGKRVACPCAPGGTCSGGVCAPVPPQDVVQSSLEDPEVELPRRRPPCDPVNPCPAPRPEGGPCGPTSAGCPGVSVTCGCASGLSCVDGSCRGPAGQTPSGTGPCRADQTHCCMPDGRLVVPGGCQPSYPPGVQSATRRGADGSCEQIPCSLRCLPETARIDTPGGPVRVSALRVGDLVYTRDATGARVAQPALRVGAVPVTGAHRMIELSLADGRVVRASAGHPVMRGGPTFGELRVGDRLDGSEIVAVGAIPYEGSHTWDVLPAGPTGEYWTDGVRVGSTLGP